MRFVSPFATLLALCLLAATPACGDDDDGAAGSAGQPSAGQAGTAGAAGSAAGSSGTSGQPGAGSSGTSGHTGAGTSGASGASGQSGAAGTSAGAAGQGGTAAGSAGVGGAAGASAGGAAGKSGGAGGGGAGGAGATTGTADEMEPNDGATAAEVNPITPGVVMFGSIGTPDDRDVFKLETKPGMVYVVGLTAPQGLSPLEGHLTVFDAGRNGKGPGNDYVKIATSGEGAHDAVLEFLAMGEGGYLLAVRDERNVPTPDGYGGADFSYLLVVEEHAASEYVQKALPLPGKTSAAFSSPGALHLYDFTVSSDMTLTADFSPAGASLDGRFFVFSSKTGDWIARNDDRSETNKSPRFDQVPLEPAGAAFLVVENASEDASALGYTLTTSLP